MPKPRVWLYPEFPKFFVEYLFSFGARFEVIDGKLKVTALDGALNDEDMEDIAHFKSEIIKIIQSKQNGT